METIITRKKLKADLMKYVDEKCKQIKSMIDISSFSEAQKETWEAARTSGLLTQSFVHLALEEGWTRAEAEGAVNYVMGKIPDDIPAIDQGTRKLNGLMEFCKGART